MLEINGHPLSHSRLDLTPAPFGAIRMLDNLPRLKKGLKGPDHRQICLKTGTRSMSVPCILTGKIRGLETRSFKLCG